MGVFYERSTTFDVVERSQNGVEAAVLPDGANSGQRIVTDRRRGYPRSMRERDQDSASRWGVVRVASSRTDDGVGPKERRLLDLQSQVGNAAVSGLVAQRRSYMAMPAIEADYGEFASGGNHMGGKSIHSKLDDFHDEGFQESKGGYGGYDSKGYGGDVESKGGFEDFKGYEEPSWK